jgi:pimeloyl-ACP methyl ester carboxylesterase
MAKHRMRDLVVILPGITGSILGDGSVAGTPDLWNVSGRAIWSFLTDRGGTLHRLAVPRHDPRQPPPETGVAPTGLIRGVHGVFGLAKIDGYQVLVDALRSRFDVVVGSWSDQQPAGLLAFPYDWRLSNRASALAFDTGIRDKLAAWRDATGEPEAQLILVAHSMGGLVARYWLEVLEGWRETRALVTFGTPYRGSVDALNYLANGYKKPFLDATKVLLSCPSVYELLPIYRSVLYDSTWHRPRELTLPVCDPDLADQAAEYVQAAGEFHDEIRSKVGEHQNDPAYRQSYARVPFVGFRQSTRQSAVLAGGALTTNDDIPAWIEDDVAGGDGTVPQVSALPIEMESSFGVTFVAGRHSGLHNIASALDDLVERLRQSQSKSLGDIQGSYTPATSAIDLVVDDAYLADEAVRVRARLTDKDGHQLSRQLRAVVVPTDGSGPATELVLRDGGEYAEAEVLDLAPGQYRVTVDLADRGGVDALPVTDVFEVAAEGIG